MPTSKIDDIKSQVCADIDKRAADLIEISREIHAHPELNFEEHFAHNILSEYIADAGVNVTRGAFELETAFDVAIKGGAGPTVAVLCEYDALPGIGHACGHNIIAAAGLGAGVALSAVVELCGGSLRLMGTPAEEGGGGKIEMARKGAFKNIDAAMMIHPADRDLARMNAIAIQQLIVRYEGLAAHAAMSPYLGKNALDAAVLGYMNVAALRQHIRPTERVHGIFTKSGEKPNIVPRQAEMYWYARSNNIESLQPLKQRVAKCLEAGAMAADCTINFEWQKNTYADLVDNLPLLKSYIQNSAQFGRILTAEYLAGTGGGSTDMGNLSYLVPSIHPMLQVAPAGVSLHSAEFAEYTAGDAANAAILDGAKIMAMTAIDMWLSDSLQAQVHQAFGSGVVPEGVF
ncbi:MAG: M20 family metallopeptidase [Acidimicrobiaceae bacterium]|nr:M20 family metallopeptidase [Acidimicrobiaceae bacterium]